jgi:hypothetical protein
MIINNPFNGKLNLDTAQYRISNGDYIDALNVTKDAEGTGQDKVISNILGNSLLPYTLPAGTNKIIGFYPDKIRNRAYYFLWNSNGFNSILYYDLSNDIIVKVLVSKTDSDGIDILNFDPSYKVLSVNVFYRDDEGDILYFNDGLNPPKSINIDADYGTSWKLEYLLIAKAPPVMPPKVTYENDTIVTVNNLRNSLYQFCYRFVYDNNEKSVWSSKSIVPLPQQPTLFLTNSDLSLNARISISVSSGGTDVKGIELSFRENNNSVISDWFLISQFDKAENAIPHNDIFTYKFYNDSIYSQIDVIESSQLQDYVPQKANAAELANGNTLLYAGITEGYNKTNMELLAYTPNSSLDIPVPIYFFKDYCGLLFFATCNGLDSGSTGRTLKIYLYGTGTNTNGQVTTLNNPVGQYVINVVNSNNVNIGYTYQNLTTPKTVSSILTDISAGLVANGNNWTQVSLDGNILIMSNTNDFTLYSSGVKYISSSTNNPDNTQFANSWDSGYQYGLQYFDGQGRTIGTQTSKLATFTTYKNNGTQFPQTYLEIKNRPPLEARYYQVVRSNNTTYNKRLYWISNSAYRSPLSLNIITSVYDLESYAYVDISNISEYNKQFSSSVNVVSYSFTPGDRITFLNRYDSTGTVSNINLYDCEILGTEASINTTVGIKEGNFIKIKYPQAAVDEEPNNFNFNGDKDFMHYEIFLYNYSTNSDESQKFFYEFGKCFGIGNYGTANAYHIGLEQTQSPTSPSTVPAIVSGTNGDLFFRKRSIILKNTWVYNCGNQNIDLIPSTTLYIIDSLIMNLNIQNGQSPFSNSDYQVSIQPTVVQLKIGGVTPVYPEFTDDGVFYNKTSGLILLNIVFDVRITTNTAATNVVPQFEMFLVSATEKTYQNIQTTHIADSTGYIFSCDTKVTIPANTKMWIGVYGDNAYVASFDLTMSVLQSKTIEIIENSFNDAYYLTMNSNGRSSVIDENARQVYYPTLIRYSQAYQINTNINGTNNFYFENFDEYDRSFGDVMRLHVRDRYLKVYQKFKVGNVPILTQIIKDSADNPLQANTDKLINKIQYFAGDYGIGDASTSLAWNNFADYFVDNYRGVVCRLSQNGIEPLSIIYFTNAFFTAKLPEYRQTLNNGAAADGAIYTGNPCIYGVFDAYTNKYIIAMEEINRYSDCTFNGGTARAIANATFTASYSMVSANTVCDNCNGVHPLEVFTITAPAYATTLCTAEILTSPLISDGTITGEVWISTCDGISRQFGAGLGPDGTNIAVYQANCQACPTTTTSTTTSTSTSTTSTTTSTSTTTTTTAAPLCLSYLVYADDGTGDKNSYDFSYINCAGDSASGSRTNDGAQIPVCAQEDTVTSTSGYIFADLIGPCGTTTTTTTAAP